VDSRDKARALGTWWDSFDEESMTLTVMRQMWSGFDEEVIFPAKYVVCNLCNGTGSHINPAIDAHGISAAEFEDDPQFGEDYHNGVYDVACYACNGKRVVATIDEDNLNRQQLKDLEWIEELKQDAEDCLAEQESERRHGA